MAKVELIYPSSFYPVYGDTLTIRYKTQNVLEIENVVKIVFILDNQNQIQSDELTGFYTFNGLGEGTHSLTGFLLNNKNKKVKNSDFYFTFKTIDKKYEPERKISDLIAKKIPEFIQNDHPRFIKFMEAYYEWMESSNNPYYMSIASGDFYDINKTPDLFLNHFRKQYLNDFPENLATNLDGDTVNLRSLIKNVRQFYNAKGSEKSFKFFFRLLYDTFVDIYYPKHDLLKASGSLWKEKKTIKVIYENIEIANSLKGKIVYQSNSDGVVNFTARVIGVQIYKSEELSITELEIMNENGIFDDFGKLYCNIDGDLFSASIVQVIDSVSIINSGFGYKLGEIIDLNWNSTDSIPLKGKSAKAKITKVKKQGQIQKIQIIDTGVFNISTTTENIFPPEIIIHTENGGNAILSANYTGISRYPGYYSKKQGHISFNKKLQDNRRYQELSYVLRTDITLNNYIVLLKKLVHPAGFYVGGDVILHGQTDDIVYSGNGLATEFKNLIGNFIAFRLNCQFDIRNFDAPDWRPDLNINGYGDIFPSGFDPTDTIPLQTIDALYNNDDPEDPNFVNVHNGDLVGQLTEGVETVFYSNIPDVSDFDKVNEYWVVFPHPNPLKEFSELSILEFAINNDNDVMFRLENG